MNTERKIVVVGSANIDLVIGVERMPRQGETVVGADLEIFPGGKGANQACAAGRLGGSVRMVAEVGGDAFGSVLLESLSAANVNIEGVGRSDRPTGCASIYVLPGGANSIVISPGANATLDPESAVRRLNVEEGDIVLCQLEVPFETVEAVLAYSKQHGALTILDPAPARPLSANVLRWVDFLTPNQTEAGTLLGDESLILDDFEGARIAAGRLIELGPFAVVMKLGEIGSLMRNRGRLVQAPAFPVRALDTTAAGDTFNGAFAVALATGKTIDEALVFANAAAAISVTRTGAQPSMPSATDVYQFLNAVEPAPNG